MRLCGAVLYRDHVARLRGGRPGGRAARLPRAPAAVRRAAGSGRGMSALTERTRLGMEVLATGVVLGIAGDALLRATPWGLNAFLCTVALAAAAAWLVHRRRIAVGRDAPWLAMAAVLLGSNFAIRDSGALRALDAMGLAILLALAGLSLRGVALRGRDAWEYVRSGVVAALSAWFGVWPLMARDIRWSELPTGGALRHARGAIGGALLAFPVLLAFGGLFAAADPLVLPFLLGAERLRRDASREHQRTLRQLSGLLLALLGVVMASALQRMRLYVAEFGLSETRLYATAFMIYLAGAFAWFAVTVLRGHWRRFAFGALVQGFAVLAGLHLLTPDALIVRTNLARTAAHRPFDAVYATSLGADAVPDLLAAFARLGDQDKCRAAAALLARWTPEGNGGKQPAADGWRNWNLARARARRAVHEHAALLKATPCPASRPPTG